MFGYPIQYAKALETFYKDQKLSTKEITKEEFDKLVYRASFLNFIYDPKDKRNSYYESVERYIKIANRLHTSFKKINTTNNMKFVTNSSTEKLILFALTVDPGFEAAIIYGSCDSKKILKEQLIFNFGLYDPALIQIENFIIKNYLTDDIKKQIQNKIDEKVYGK